MIAGNHASDLETLRFALVRSAALEFHGGMRRMVTGTSPRGPRPKRRCLEICSTRISPLSHQFDSKLVAKPSEYVAFLFRRDRFNENP
jgi:hypothetical protein